MNPFIKTAATRHLVSELDPNSALVLYQLVKEVEHDPANAAKLAFRLRSEINFFHVQPNREIRGATGPEILNAELLLAAAKYGIGRATAGTHTVIEEIESALSTLPDQVIGQMVTAIKSALADN